MGEKGSVAYDARRDETVVSETPKAAKVVSTVGAGDSYGAAFVHAYMQGKPLAECVSRATWLSCRVVECLEAVPLIGEK